MIPRDAALASSYDYGEVARSGLIAIAASYVALARAGCVTAAKGGRARLAWLGGGATAMASASGQCTSRGCRPFTCPWPSSTTGRRSWRHLCESSRRETTLVRQSEVHSHGGLYGRRLAIHNIGFIAPPAHCIQGCQRQCRGPANNLHLCHCSVGTHNRIQYHRALDSRLSSGLGILGHDLVSDPPPHSFGRHCQLWLRHLGLLCRNSRFQLRPSLLPSPPPQRGRDHDDWNGQGNDVPGWKPPF